MKVQYFSDVHLEFGPLPVPPIAGVVVVAAGDIGVGTEGLEWLAEFDAPVVYVTGNHEFYDHEIDAAREAIAARARELGIHFLGNDAVIIDDVRFLGTTLWSDFDGGTAPIFQAAQEYMNDFHLIGKGERTCSAADALALSRESQRFLREALPVTGSYRRTVVVTHHAPTLDSWDDRRDPVFRPAYCNRLDDLISEHAIDAWIHGHVHTPFDYTRHGTRIVCNPRGYAGVGVVPGFDPTRTVEV